jgi:hypothetical protein
MILKHKKLFTKEECELIIQQAKSNQDKDDVIWDISAKKYNGWHFLYKNENNRWVYDKLFQWLKEETGEEINKEKLIIDRMESPQFVHQYSKGDFFIRHKDKVLNNTFYRKYNFGIQLSDDYDGGELVVWDENDIEHIIPKKVGTALFYNSELAHEVRTITDGIRYAFIFILDSDYIEKNKSII